MQKRLYCCFHMDERSRTTMRIGHRVRRERVKRGWSVRELARRAANTLVAEPGACGSPVQLGLSRFELAGPPTPRDTEASNAYAVIHDLLGPVCICSLIGINSNAWGVQQVPKLLCVNERVVTLLQTPQGPVAVVMCIFH